MYRAMFYTNMCVLIAGLTASHTLIRSLPAIRSSRMHLTGLTTPEYKFLDRYMVMTSAIITDYSFDYPKEL